MVALRSMVACLFMLTLGLPLTAESQPERVLFIPLATPCRALDTRLPPGTPIPADRANHHPDQRNDNWRRRL